MHVTRNNKITAFDSGKEEGETGGGEQTMITE